jgi:folate-binding protein YgfZ
VAQVSATGQPGFPIFAPAAQRDRLIAVLEAAGAARAGAEAVRTVRIENGKPRYGEEISDTTLPQETQQMHAVHFQKGCYLGQEAVAKVRNLGHPTRVVLMVSADRPVEANRAVLAGDLEAGLLTSVDTSGDAVSALARIRWAAREADLRTADGVRLRRR